MIWRIEIREKNGFYDAVGASVKHDIAEIGYGKKVADVKAVIVYLIQGDLTENDIKFICDNLLTDPVTQTSTFIPSELSSPVAPGYKVVEVAYNPGVMDPVEESTRKAIYDLGIKNIQSIKTARKYLIKGSLSYKDIHAIADRVLYNKVIQHLVIGHSSIPPEPPPYTFSLKSVPIRLASKKMLQKISKDGQLFLSIDEMKAIRTYFRKQKRDPTDCELETIAQTWSEHCKHKTFRGLIDYQGKTIRNLLKSTIMKVTDELAKDWCVSVFKDNAGIIRFDETHNVCFKVETHNHPSALEPYGGAGTGIGGVIRDTLGTGMGAKPIINSDIFCFGSLNYPYKKLPKGALHPRRVMKGVVAGVRDYGNRMGIPTSNGAVLFDDDFVGNPLVFCGNVGILPRGMSFKQARTGDHIVVVGGRTGRDGIHGATFSSGELTHESENVSGSAVQIGNPIQEKKVTDTLLRARDAGLYTAITDCGAGGLSSAVGEMGEKLGAEVHLEKVPLKYKGLPYDEIWISEAQERMVLSVPPKKLDALIKIFNDENVEAISIGVFTRDKRLRLFYEGHTVCDIEMSFIHDGDPAVHRKAVWIKPLYAEPRIRSTSLTEDLVSLMAMPNIASKEWIIRQYDHEVQGGSVLKPLQGITEDGPGDACITRPVLGSKKGVIISCGINPDYGKIDPYWMAASVIDEALRQVIAVGGRLDRCALLDNFCWGNCNKPDRLGGLVRASQACYDIARVYEVPFISGKDSLNNEFATKKGTIAIPPTLLISCISVMDDVSRAVTMDAKEPGSAIYLVGLTHDELGGSQFYKMRDAVGNAVPRLDPVFGKKLMEALSGAIQKGTVASCHDCSDGGMAVALAEMAFAGGLGMDLTLNQATLPFGQKALPDHVLLFAESNTRFIVETANEKAFIKAMKGLPIWKLGTITGNGSFAIRNFRNKRIVSTTINALKKSWQGTLKEL